MSLQTLIYSGIDIADFTNPAIAADDELCGPKGAMLADMLQTVGDNVSPGFTVTGEAYDLFRKQNNIDKLLNIDHNNKIITQKRELNPPSFNARFRNKVKEKYPEYELK